MNEAEHRALVAHYDRAAPLLVRQFGAIPVGYVTYPFGLHERGVHHSDAGPVPISIPTVDVTTSTGSHAYVALAENALLWLVHAKYAVEFVS